MRRINESRCRKKAGQLVIENPADAVSVGASSHHQTMRYEADIAIDAVANDRTVVDAEEEFGRAATVAGMPSEAVVGVPSLMTARPDSTVEEGPVSAGPIQPARFRYRSEFPARFHVHPWHHSSPSWSLS